MANIKRRLEQLEGGRRGKGIPIIVAKQGETKEEAMKKHLAEHPEDENAGMYLIICGRRQGPPPPLPSRPKPKEPKTLPDPTPITIIY